MPHKLSPHRGPKMRAQIVPLLPSTRIKDGKQVPSMMHDNSPFTQKVEYVKGNTVKKKGFSIRGKNRRQSKQLVRLSRRYG